MPSPYWIGCNAHACLIVGWKRDSHRIVYAYYMWPLSVFWERNIDITSRYLKNERWACIVLSASI